MPPSATRRVSERRDRQEERQRRIPESNEAEPRVEIARGRVLRIDNDRVDADPPGRFEALAEKLSTMFRAVPDAELLATINFLRSVPDSWQYLEADVRQRLQNYVSSLPADDLDQVDFLLRYAPLQMQARDRVRAATKKELREALFFDLPSEVADKYIDFYLESRSFDDANDWAKHMIVHTGDFTADHVRRLLENAAKNDQILGSFQLGPLISNLRSRKKLSDAEFESLLQQNGLEEHTFAARSRA